MRGRIRFVPLVCPRGPLGWGTPVGKLSSRLGRGLEGVAAAQKKAGSPEEEPAHVTLSPNQRDNSKNATTQGRRQEREDYFFASFTKSTAPSWLQGAANRNRHSRRFPFFQGRVVKLARSADYSFGQNGHSFFSKAAEMSVYGGIPSPTVCYGTALAVQSRHRIPCRAVSRGPLPCLRPTSRSTFLRAGDASHRLLVFSGFPR